MTYNIDSKHIRSGAAIVYSSMQRRSLRRKQYLLVCGGLSAIVALRITPSIPFSIGGSNLTIPSTIYLACFLGVTLFVFFGLFGKLYLERRKQLYCQANGNAWDTMTGGSESITIEEKIITLVSRMTSRNYSYENLSRILRSGNLYVLLFGAGPTAWFRVAPFNMETQALIGTISNTHPGVVMEDVDPKKIL